jgi:hypothetical protein
MSCLKVVLARHWHVFWDMGKQMFIQVSWLELPDIQILLVRCARESRWQQILILKSFVIWCTIFEFIGVYWLSGTILIESNSLQDFTFVGPYGSILWLQDCIIIIQFYPHFVFLPWTFSIDYVVLLGCVE